MSRMAALLAVIWVIGVIGCGAKPSKNSGSTTHDASTLSTDETWAKGTHTVLGTIHVTAGKLTIAAGSTVNFAAGTQLVVSDGGSLAINGTADSRVVLTGSSATPGFWAGVDIQASADPSSVIANANIGYAGDAAAAVLVEDGATLGLQNSRIENANNYGLSVLGAATLSRFAGNAIVHNALAVITDARAAAQLAPSDPNSPSVLTPNTVEGIAVGETTLGVDATWANVGVAYVADSIIMSAATGTAKLTLDAGVIVQMLPGALWSVHQHGALTCNGTANAPVTLTSASATPAPGDWKEIDFYADSLAAENLLNCTTIQYGGGATNGIYGAVWVDAAASVTVQNSTIGQSKNLGISAVGGLLPNFTGNTIAHNASNPIDINAGQVSGLGAGTYTPNGAEGVLVEGDSLNASATWAALGVPLLIQDAVTVGADTGPDTVTLTLSPGVALHFGDGIGMTVRAFGQLASSGSASAHVTLTSDDGSDAWQGLTLDGAGNSLTYTDFSYGGNDGSQSTGQLVLGSASSSVALSQVTFAHPQNGTCSIVENGGTVTGASSSDICP